MIKALPGRVLDILVGMTLLAGMALTCWGLAHLSWPQAVPWSTDGIRSLGIFVIVCVAVVALGSLWSKRSPLVVGGSVAIGLALLSGALWPLLVTLWFAFSSIILGKSILSTLKISTEENWLTNFLLGSGIYGTVVGLLAHFPVNYPGVYALLLAAPVLFGWRILAEQESVVLMRGRKSARGCRFNALDVAIAAIALTFFATALMPELGFDALWMHMFVPAHMSIRHQWGFDVGTYVWAVIPMLGDWMFSLGYMLGGESASRMINVGFIFILAWLVRDLVLWAGGSIMGARWAAFIFLSSPLAFTEGSSLHIESVWSAFLVAGLLAILQACSLERNPKNELIIGVLFFGLAATAKAITLTILPIPLLILAWQYRTWFGEICWQRMSIYTGLFFASGSIPYVTAWWLTGNPVFPFFNGIFMSGYFPPVNFDSSTIFGKGVSWDVLYRITFESGKYLEAGPGASGFQWLMLYSPTAAFLLAARHIRGIVLLLAGTLTVVLVFHSVSYLRYVFPAWVILAAAIGVAMSSVLATSGHIKKAWTVVATAAVALNLLFFCSGAPYKDFALKSISDENSRTRYLSSRLPIRNAVELVNNLNVGGNSVAVFSSPLTAGLAANALYADWTNTVFEKEITQATSERDIVDSLLRRGVVFVILDSNWKSGSVKIEQIKKATEVLAENNSVSVRRIKADYLFKTELLVDPDFESINGWVLSPSTKYDAKTGVISANVSTPATQSVVVSPNRHYLVTVVARCATVPALGRVQVNWIGSGGEFVNADIKTFECSDSWTEQAMQVIAPKGITTAVVYVSGHTKEPLEFKRASLRQ